eukprot:jgi/Chlat1/5552/Chrsp369S00411
MSSSVVVCASLSIPSSRLSSTSVGSGRVQRRSPLHFRTENLPKGLFFGDHVRASKRQCQTPKLTFTVEALFGGRNPLSSPPATTSSTSTALVVKEAAKTYLSRLQKSGNERVIFYWGVFGALTGSGALALEFLLHSTFDLPPGSIAAAFATVVSGLALFQFSRLQFSKQGSGPAVAMAVGGRPADRTKFRDLYSVVEEIAADAGIPVPSVFILDKPDMNAFAAGLNPDEAAVTVTTGMLQKADRNELKAVLGHEIGHIIHGDSKSGTHLASVLFGFYGTTSAKERAIQSLPEGPALSTSCITGSAFATPEAMKSVLVKIEKNASEKSIGGQRHYAHLFIHAASPAPGQPGSGGLFSGLLELLATHPPVPKRLENIDKVAEELEELQRQLLSSRR